MKPKYGKDACPNAFIIGCVARNQHRKNIPRLIKGYAQFVKANNLTPDETKLFSGTLTSMDWDKLGIGAFGLLRPVAGAFDFSVSQDIKIQYSMTTGVGDTVKLSEFLAEFIPAPI